MNMTLLDFIRESNRIEGILREPTPREIEAHEEFLTQEVVTLHTLDNFVALVASGAALRDSLGMDVRVGGHLPPRGGSAIREKLDSLLTQINGAMEFGMTPAGAHSAHCVYEILHPFMDGNGRSGRVLWLWMMGGVENVPLGFLHTWYYQSLSASRAR